ncbi:MAG: 16S rRNA (uracil(1498)-N(3))-methyltransferase, partial [Gammaproteobacteria bacterium]
MTRLYCPLPLSPGAELELPERATRHAATVLRMRPGDEVILFDGRGGEYPAELLEVSRRRVRVRVGGQRAVERESSLRITLLQGISRGERMDYTIQKAVELGVGRIVPLTTRRCNVRLDDDRARRRLEHWRGVVISACEQCGRNRLPELTPVTPLPALAELELPARRMVLQAGGGRGLRPEPECPVEVAVLTGPEGGFAPEEL